MKSAFRLTSALLALVLVFSLLPLGAAAKEKTGTVTIIHHFGEDTSTTTKVTVGEDGITLLDRGYVEIDGKYYAFSHYSNDDTSVKIPGYDGSSKWEKTYGKLSAYYKRHTHSYQQLHDRTYHWMGCECGKYYDKARHVDPATDADKVCTCGYIFSSNCDLSTLWLENMVLTERFHRETTDYIGQIHTYKEVNATRIAAHTYDALATVELPTDLSLKDGSNVFEIKVTAEDTVSTKTYTVTAVKPARVAGILIESDGTSISAQPKTTVSRVTATAKIPELLVERMAEMAAADGCTQIVLDPQFSKWGCKQIDVPLTAGVLKTIAEDTEAELLIHTHFGDVHIPNADLETIAGNCETFTVSILKEEDIILYCDGEKLTEIPEGVYRDLY